MKMIRRENGNWNNVLILNARTNQIRWSSLSRKCLFSAYFCRIFGPFSHVYLSLKNKCFLCTTQAKKAFICRRATNVALWKKFSRGSFLMLSFLLQRPKGKKISIFRPFQRTYSFCSSEEKSFFLSPLVKFAAKKKVLRKKKRKPLVKLTQIFCPSLRRVAMRRYGLYVVNK